MTSLHNIFHIFGGCLRSKIPLPSYLPDAKTARLKLADVFKSHPIVAQGEFVQSNIEYIYYYTFISAMKEVVFETDKMAAALRSLFGDHDHMKGIWDDQLPVDVKVE